MACLPREAPSNPWPGRLQGIAEPNRVVIAEGTRKLLGNLFELEDLGDRDLKGIAGPARAWAALRAISVESRFEALHATGLTALVGGEEESELLLRRWSRAKNSEGQVVLLSGRFAQRHADKRGRNRPETIYFLGLTLYCTRNRKGNFKVGMRTEKSRLRRSLMSLQERMRQIRHHTISDQVSEINAVLRGHYAYYGVAGNIRALFKVYRAVERYWRRMLCSRSWAGRRLTWDVFHQIKQRTPLLRPKLRLPYRELQALAVL
jgi:hypothetical protein